MVVLRRVWREGVGGFDEQGMAALRADRRPKVPAAAGAVAVTYNDYRQVHQTVNVTVAAPEPAAIPARATVRGVVLSRSEEVTPGKP